MSEAYIIECYKRIRESRRFGSSYAERTFMKELIELAFRKPTTYKGKLYQAGQISTDYRSLADYLGIAVNTVEKYLKALAKDGDIIVESDYQHTEITIVDFEYYTNPKCCVSKFDTRSDTRLDTLHDTRSDTRLNTYTLRSNTLKYESIYTEQFNEFYSAYPSNRRGDRSKAAQMYDAVIAQMVQPEDIMAALRYDKMMISNLQYMPSIEKWMAGEPWLEYKRRRESEHL